MCLELMILFITSYIIKETQRQSLARQTSFNVLMGRSV